MAENGYPKPVPEVVSTLVDIFRHQQRNDIVELLENASAQFDAVNYDNWNGGTTTWGLRLEVPVPIFAAVEPKLSALEKDILGKLSYYDRINPNDPIGQVAIVPLTPGATAIGHKLAPSEIEVRRIWPQGHFRLFLSHVSLHKTQVSELKDALADYGIAGFVAHEDIQPSLEWQREIELALRSMHALAALVTPDFHASNWTDQEVGWAFGRGVLVVPVRLGADPYGFAGKVQGANGRLEHSKTLASSIVGILLKNPQTHREMRRALVTALSRAKMFEWAISLSKILVEIEDFTEEEKVAMRNACEENSIVSRAYGVPERIYAAFGKPAEPPSIKDDDVPF